MITIIIFGKVTWGLIHGLEDLEIRGQVETIQTNKIGHNTERSPGNLLSLKLQ